MAGSAHRDTDELDKYVSFATPGEPGWASLMDQEAIMRASALI